MQRHSLLLVLLGIFTVQVAHAQFEGTVGAGLHLGYGTEINSLGGGAHIHYYRTNNVRLAPSFTYFLERKGTGMWMVDADAHYILPVSVTASLYPIGGLHYSRWAFNSTGEGEIIVPKRTDNRLGINLGLGIQHDIAYRVRANYELKYQFIRDHSQVFFSAGFGFWF